MYSVKSINTIRAIFLDVNSELSDCVGFFILGYKILKFHFVQLFILELSMFILTKELIFSIEFISFIDTIITIILVIFCFMQKLHTFKKK